MCLSTRVLRDEEPELIDALRDKKVFVGVCAVFCCCCCCCIAEETELIDSLRDRFII